MNTTNKQNLESTSHVIEHLPHYPLWVRIVASLIRLTVRVLTPPLMISNMILTKLMQRPKVILDDVERSPRFYVWLSVLTALILLACFALLASLITSMDIFEFSIQIPWETMIATYIFLVVAGSGLCIINALGAVFGMARYELISRRMVFLSLTTILFGLTCILMHLGHPERVPIYNAISPNFRSAISWMGLLYNIYLVIVVVEFWLLIRTDLAERGERTKGLAKTVVRLITLKKFEKSRLGNVLKDPRLPRLIGTLAFVIGVSALITLGSVFAHIESRVLWYGAYYPIYFLLSALFSGYALLLVVTVITYWARGDEMLPEVKALIFEMAEVLAILLAVGLVLTAYRLTTGLYNPVMRGPVMLLLKGPFSLAFWVFEIGLMTLLPVFAFIRATKKNDLRYVLLGSMMVLTGAFVMRYVFVVAGQVHPNIKEGLPSYLPTVMEIFLIGGVFGALLITYTLAERFLPLKEEGLHHV